MRVKRCKICKKAIENPRFGQVVCSYPCSTELLKQKKQKAWNKEKKILKESIKPRRVHLRELQVVFNTYIRLRDKTLPCISCGSIKQDIKYDAGHFYSVGAYPNLRFNEDNVHKQCSNNCNKHLSGNIHEYRPRLIERIGQERFNKLEQDKNEPLRLTLLQIKEKMTYYKKEIKKLKEVHH